MHFVYVLHSASTGRYYTGSTSDLARRIKQHNEGITRSTKHGRPWVLVHQEQFATSVEAFRRERYLKTGRGRDELKALLKHKGV